MSQVRSTAAVSSYVDWPCCCSGEANYRANCPTTECDDFNACAHWGNLAWIPDTKLPICAGSVNIVSFFDKANMGPTISTEAAATFYQDNYAGRKISFSLTCADNKVVQVEAVIADYCADADCLKDLCCSTNAGSKQYLVDVEYATVNRACPNNALEDGTNTLNAEVTNFVIY
jgi:hypothetical protein